MKVIPKLQNGGFVNYFTTYQPVQTPQIKPQVIQESSSNSTKVSSKSDDDTKGKLTEKDFFGMIKDINGLPNEMTAIVSNLQQTFQLQNIMGLDTNDLASQYLKNLLQIKIAAQNKDKYDQAWKDATTNGAMAEPAIAMNGNLVVQTRDGKMKDIRLDTYFNNRDQYKPLSVSQLLNLRAYSSATVNDQNIFNIASNSMGFESFQKLIDSAKTSLGTNTYTRNGMFTKEGQASKGLEALQKLQDDPRLQQITGAVTLDGLYEYKLIDSNQKQQIGYLLKYMMNVLPERAKTWAAIKQGNPNKAQATSNLVLNYLLSTENVGSTVDTNYIGAINENEELGRSGTKSGNSTKSGTNKEEDPKEGFWRQVQSGKGGDESTFTVLMKNGRMSVDSKYYGTTPGLDTNKSLGDYISSSNVGYLIKNNRNITFGDTKIAPGSFNDIMINAATGAAVVTLPINPDGTVDLEISQRYMKVLDELKRSGLQPNTDAYNQKQQSLMKREGLDTLIDSNGLPNRNRFGQFLVLEGYTSDKAKAVRDNKEVSFGDINSNYVLPAGDDSSLYDMMKKGLSNKDRGDYDLGDGVFGFFADKLYKGNIYVPLNTNPINAQNADENDIKSSTAKLLEKDQQQKSTSSTDL